MCVFVDTLNGMFLFVFVFLKDFLFKFELDRSSVHVTWCYLFVFGVLVQAWCVVSLSIGLEFLRGQPNDSWVNAQ